MDETRQTYDRQHRNGLRMSGQHPLERQWIIIQTLSARRYGVTVRELADDLGVSQKTIRRDLKLLAELGFPIKPREGAHGRNHWVADSTNGTLPLPGWRCLSRACMYCMSCSDF